MSKFKDPYENLPERERHRTTIDVGGKDKSFLVSCHNRRGTVQVTLNILMFKLIEQLKANGITEYDPERYEAAVADCAIVFACANRTTNAHPTCDGNSVTCDCNNPRSEQTPSGDVGHRTVPMACVPAPSTTPTPDAPRALESKRAPVAKRKVAGVKRQAHRD